MRDKERKNEEEGEERQERGRGETRERKRKDKGEERPERGRGKTRERERKEGGSDSERQGWEGGRNPRLSGQLAVGWLWEGAGI